jgi:hypothetical protein
MSRGAAIQQQRRQRSLRLDQISQSMGIQNRQKCLKTGDIPRIFETLIPLSAIVYVDPWSSGECRTKGLFCPISAWTKLVRTGKIWHPTRAAHAAARPAKLPFSRTRKLGRGGFTTLRASRVRWRQVAPARQDRNAGETDRQKKYRVCEAVPRR